MNDRNSPSIHLGSTKADNRLSAADAIRVEDTGLYEGVMWRRCLAWIVDYAICLILSLVLSLATCTAAVATLGLLSVPAALLAPAVIQVALACMLLAGPRGATPGMRAFGLRVVSQTGTRPDPFQTLLMPSLFYASALIFFPVLAAGFFSERSRLLHDMMAGTLVIRDKMKIP